MVSHRACTGIDRIRMQLRAAGADQAACAHAARDGAAVLSAWSLTLEGERPGPLARAARQLARSAELPAHTPRKSGRREPRETIVYGCLAVISGGATTATTSPLTHTSPSTTRSLRTTTFFVPTSTIRPRTVMTFPCGVGFAKSAFKDAVTQRGTGAPSPNVCPSRRYRESEALPVL